MSDTDRRAPTHAECQRPLLLAEIGRLRSLLADSAGDGAERPSASVAGPLGPGDDLDLDRLAHVFGLSRFERDVLLLAVAVELDAEVAAGTAALQAGDPRPTFDLALRVLPEPHWDALAPSRPLRYWRLLEVGHGATLTTSPLHVDEWLLQHAVGLPGLDQRLEGVVRVGRASAVLAGAHAAVVDELGATVARLGPALVHLAGDDVEARGDVAARVAAGFGRLPLVVHARALPAPGPELSAVVRCVDREALALDGLVVVEAEGASSATLAAFADASAEPIILSVGEGSYPASGRTVLRRSVDLPDPGDQRRIWLDVLPAEITNRLAPELAEISQHHRLSANAIASMATELQAVGPVDGSVLRDLCRARSRQGLEGLAQRVVSDVGWDDLVLPDGHLEVLQEIVRHVRHRSTVHEGWGFEARSSRGLGITALFSGESGTGKTLAAEVMAAELELDLYRIDLSATVSKYIGETEKNLRRVFDAAEASGCVLLFDEADALFGKRGEVKDSHDRYANLEVAYLLQRMESYRGLAILTTNLRSHLDRAFLRRIRFVVQFPFPDEAQRVEIWRRAFPPATPLDGVDATRLARLALPGGSIRAMALTAAFAAADDGTAVTPTHLLRAARIEYAKSDRALAAVELAALT